MAEARKLEHGFRRISARNPYIHYLRGTRIMMFQLSGFYYIDMPYKVYGLG